MAIWKVIFNCIYYKYASFKGRASRKEFLVYFIFFVLFCIFWNWFILASIKHFGDVNLIDFVMMYIPVFLLVPLISVMVRRFHDLGKTGWLFLLLLVPVINVFGFYLLLRKGNPGANIYGQKPVHISLV